AAPRLLPQPHWPLALQSSSIPHAASHAPQWSWPRRLWQPDPGQHSVLAPVQRAPAPGVPAELSHTQLPPPLQLSRGPQLTLQAPQLVTEKATSQYGAPLAQSRRCALHTHARLTQLAL